MLWKELGETPLQCLLRFRRDNPEHEKTNMTYIGRLDPLAEGVMLVLMGDTRNKEEYLALDKTYEFEILWGFETDTYDTLGLVTKVGEAPIHHFDRKIDPLLQTIAQKKTQTYPPYSSKTVMGKSLHTWAREGKIDEIELPTRHIHIASLKHIHTRLVSYDEMQKEIHERISLVKGDFRQEEILKRWDEVLKVGGQALITKCIADVSSGTYIRSLTHEMGEKWGCGALAWSIKRTRVGEWTL